MSPMLILWDGPEINLLLFALMKCLKCCSFLRNFCFHGRRCENSWPISCHGYITCWAGQTGCQLFPMDEGTCLVTKKKKWVLYRTIFGSLFIYSLKGHILAPYVPVSPSCVRVWSANRVWFVTHFSHSIPQICSTHFSICLDREIPVFWSLFVEL